MSLLFQFIKTRKYKVCGKYIGVKNLETTVYASTVVLLYPIKSFTIIPKIIFGSKPEALNLKWV